MRPVAPRIATPSRCRRLALAAAAVMAAATPAGISAADPAADESAPRDTVLRLHGSDTIGASLISDLLAAFFKAEGWTELSRVPAAGSSAYNVVGRPSPSAKLAGAYVEVSDPESALAALDQGFADIAMSSRRARPAEVRQLARLGDLGSAQCEHVLALDAVAVVTNAANPIESLTRQQLKEIFTRRLVSWKELGGEGPIHLYARDAKSGTYAAFQSAVLEDEELATDALRFADNRSLAEAVAADPRGLGFVGLAFAGRNRILAISDGQRLARPVAAAIRNGEYAMSRRLYLYTAASPENALAKKFIAFAGSPSGQAIVLKDGFISAAAENTPVAEPAASPSPASSPAATAPPVEINASPAAAPIPEPRPRPRRQAAQPEPAPRPTPAATPAPRPPRPAAAKPKATTTPPSSTPPDAQPPGGAGG